ncbi:MAG TPA: CHAD domain-containing protein [Vicinamibacterales bacterium]|nr:CHAD domain-containing protein [Vicinamibacterales bacterium]
MSYRLRVDEPVRRGLQRLATTELKRARDDLRRAHPPHEHAIHEARKRLKKVDVIFRLVRDDGGGGTRGAAKRLRMLKHTLSPIRDADAMVVMLGTLKTRNPRLFGEHGFARLRRQLSAHKRELLDQMTDDRVWQTVDRTLRRLRRMAKRWRTSHRSFAAVAPAIRRTFRRGRNAMKRAMTRQRADDFHGWRKEMKSLWYELRLIEMAGAAVRKDIHALHRAETWLGDHHNIVVLCNQLTRDVSERRAFDVDRLRLAADRYQAILEKQTLAAMRRFYGRDEDRYVDNLRRDWKRRRAA